MLLPLINHEKRFIVCWNAKAGCTAVKRWYLSTIGVNPDDVNPHKFLTSVMVPSGHQIQNEFKDYYKFIVCRNPWRRIVSYYKNKKVAVWWKNKTWPIDVRDRTLNSENFTFRQLVEYVYKTPDRFLEQHVQSQTSNLDGINFDKIVKLENFSLQMNDVCDKLKIDNRDFTNPNKTLETGNKTIVSDLNPKEFTDDNMPSYECFYDENLKEMISFKFKKDIEFFNYKFED